MASLEEQLHHLTLRARARGQWPRHNYINVSRPPTVAIVRTPAAVAKLAHPATHSQPPGSVAVARRSSPKIPAVPQSQEVKKFIKEPSYSTNLQLELRRSQQQVNGINLETSDGPIYYDFGDFSNYDQQLEINVEGSNNQYNSPPSPVSSSYSELRQATKVPPGYHLQQLQQHQQQQALSNYEPLYEPVAPAQPQPHGPGLRKQDLQLLYQATRGYPTAPEILDDYGACAKCQGRILSQADGCGAMNRAFHVACFTCHRCQVELKNKPFYVLDGQPYCQRDYMDTLEKCCKCHSPIKDRVLRATGKPFHPKCFSCVACSKLLDGVPFTVDATNQIHCCPCFHRRFAPKCSVCRQPIMPSDEDGRQEQVRVVALDRSFHVDCYRCEDCHVKLTDEAEGGQGCYPLDDHVLCKRCNTDRIHRLTNSINMESRPRPL